MEEKGKKLRKPVTGRGAVSPVNGLFPSVFLTKSVVNPLRLIRGFPAIRGFGRRECGGGLEAELGTIFAHAEVV